MEVIWFLRDGSQEMNIHLLSQLLHLKLILYDACHSCPCTKVKCVTKEPVGSVCRAARGEKRNAHFYCVTCTDEQRAFAVAVCEHGSVRGTECHSFHCSNPF